MRTVFFDTSTQKEFDRKGYIQAPFLDDPLIEKLKKIYFDLLPERGGSLLEQDVDFSIDKKLTYDFTFIDRSYAYKQKVFNEITKIFTPLTDKLLVNYKPIIANFIHKDTKGGEVPLHQNWAFVDEQRFSSVSVWCPLVDSNEDNGTLQMVDGSHKRFGKTRGPMVPWELEPIKETIIDKYLSPLNVRAGQAIILDDSIVHYSNINNTEGLRLAIQLIMIPQESPSIHFHMDAQNDPESVHMLEVNRDFFTGFNPWKKPEGARIIKSLKFEKQELSEEDFVKILNGPRFDQPKINPINKWFKNLFKVKKQKVVTK